MNKLAEILEQKIFISLKDWKVFSLSGDDVESFLQGQVTSDIKELKEFGFQASSRLCNRGKIQYTFFILKDEKSHYILVDLESSAGLVKDLDAYLISEDVEIKEFENNWALVLGLHSELIAEQVEECFFGNFFRCRSVIVKKDLIDNSFKELSRTEIDLLALTSGSSFIGFDIQKEEVINTTLLNEYAISYSKGCFLGYETASKVKTRSVARSYPMLFIASDICDFKIGSEVFFEGEEFGKLNQLVSYEGKTYLSITVRKKYRNIGKDLILTIEDKEVSGNLSFLPYFDVEKYFSEKSRELFEEGIELFHKEDLENAIEKLKLAILNNKNNIDAYESLGVIFGHKENFQDAIEVMDIVLELDPKSIMAHTNKSIFYMKMGNIDKAEEEKAIATSLSFSSRGSEGEDYQKKMAMFLEVLEIDPDDHLANSQISEIYLKEGQYKKAKEHCEKLFELDRDDYKNLYNLAKCHKALNNDVEAEKLLEKSYAIALGKGETVFAERVKSEIR